MTDQRRLADLFQGYYNGTASTAEEDELMNMLKDVPEAELSELLESVWQQQHPEQDFFPPDVKQKMIASLQPAENGGTKLHSIAGERRVKWMKLAVAAAVLGIVATTVFYLVRKEPFREVAQGPKMDTQKKEDKPSTMKNDVAPGGDRATLTLADGSVVFLDSAAKGALTEQGGITVLNLDGQLAYQGSESQAAEVLYNTVSTPRGGQYQLVLADGTKVWLNAASSLRFPTVFPGEERSVELTGEGYFEVSHDAAKPFHVKVNDMEVQVLGTHFNINSYSDEPAVKTTLLAGRIKVMKHGKHVILNPGQQAVIQPKEDHIRVAYGVDLEEVIAWKDGRFLFNSAGIETIMRQAERWYNVEVIYEGKTDETFSGVVPRSENISQLLKILEATDRVDFEIRGKEVIVKSK